MMVRCTRRQYEHINKVVSQQPESRKKQLAGEWLTADVMEVSQRRIAVSMPAIGWNTIEEWMFNVVYDDRGFKTKGVSESMVKALQTVRAAINVRENHPALGNIAMLGQVTDIIPAWKMMPGSARDYAPYPRHGSEFTVLAPVNTKLNGHPITKWVEANQLIGSSVLLTEHTHLDWIYE